MVGIKCHKLISSINTLHVFESHEPPLKCTLDQVVYFSSYLCDMDGPPTLRAPRPSKDSLVSYTEEDLV